MGNWWLEALLNLQAADLRRRDLEARLTQLPREMNSLIAKRDRLAAESAAAAEAVKKEELAIKRDESEVERLNAESRKLQQQSALVKKNNEYQAMLQAIAANNSKVGQIEEQLLERFDRLEELKKNAVAVKNAGDIEVKAVKMEFDELVAFSAEVKKEIAKLDADRPKLIKCVDVDKLRVYEQLLKSRNAGTPVVKVENGICGSCHLRITPQSMNALKKSEFISCDNCQHLVYLAESLNE